MKRGHLSEYFSGIAAKRLSAVEADLLRSNQHEFNGVQALKRILGDTRSRMPARLIYLTDEQDAPVSSSVELTWYDAREQHQSRSEFRLYFPDNPASALAKAGDLLVIGKRTDGSVLVVICEEGSTVANQVCWLLGVDGLPGERFTVTDSFAPNEVELIAEYVLESLGISTSSTEDVFLEDMLRMFPGGFPPTRAFSAYARATLPDVDAKDSADLALMAWMEREEALFRSFERYWITARLKEGFGADVDSFISYSLSVQNRRKSRVGLALENHLEQVFVAHQVNYSRTAITENKTKPDYLFPGAAEYHNRMFDAERLTMLGVKSTCKDRWRQVLAEADRIKTKHLLTLEPAVSESQTGEMQAKALQLVIPDVLHHSYRPAQREWLMSVGEFVSLLKEREIH